MSAAATSAGGLGGGGRGGGGGGGKGDKGSGSKRCPRCGNRSHGDSQCWAVCSRCSRRHHPEQDCSGFADRERGGGRGGRGGGPAASVPPSLFRAQHMTVYAGFGEEFGGGPAVAAAGVGGATLGGDSRIDKPAVDKSTAKTGRNARRRANLERRLRAEIEERLAAAGSGSDQPTNSNELNPTVAIGQNPLGDQNLGGGGSANQSVPDLTIVGAQNSAAVSEQIELADENLGGGGLIRDFEEDHDMVDSEDQIIYSDSGESTSQAEEELRLNSTDSWVDRRTSDDFRARVRRRSPL